MCGGYQVKIKMRERRTLGVYLGIGIFSLLLGIALGWKLHGVRLGYLKKRRQFHSKKAEELQSKLNY